MDKKHIYMDNAATTCMREEVLRAMLPYFCEDYGNASSFHAFGRNTSKAVEDAREAVARAIHSVDGHVYFTSGGTESDNWALKGYALHNQNKGKHIISSAIEHHAVLRSLECLERLGFSVTYLPVDDQGMVSPQSLREAIREDTILVSVMMANNEVGTIQPIAELGEIAHEAGIAFHTDAVQAVGSVPVDVEQLGVDMLSMSAHKFYGPKGMGALYVRRGIALDSFMDGGEQERGLRGSTYNTPGIVGLGKAIELAVQHLDEYQDRVTAMRQRLIERVTAEVQDVRLNGHPVNRLPGNVNLAFGAIEAEALLFGMDYEGLAASAGSACSSGSMEPSHVLQALRVPERYLESSVRFSLGTFNTMREVDDAVDIVKGQVERLRAISAIR